MIRRHSVISPHAQQGAAALIMLIILVLGASYLFVSELNRSSLQTERNKITAAALAQAKEALIGYAAADSNRPGELPCPDVTNDGNSLPVEDYDGSNCKNLVGRLPWSTLRLPDLRDGYGEHLWYALSNDFHANGSATLNSGKNGALTVVGSYSANGVVAIIFAPGPALGTQPRDVPNENNLANYLEGKNASAGSTFEAANPSDMFNDKLLPITHNDLFSIVTRRIASEFAAQLTHPYPSSIPTTSLPWFESNWKGVTVYEWVTSDKATIRFDGYNLLCTITWKGDKSVSQCH